MKKAIVAVSNGEISVSGDVEVQRKIRKILEDRNEAISAINAIGLHIKAYNIMTEKGTPESVAMEAIKFVNAVAKIVVLKPTTSSE